MSGSSGPTAPIAIIGMGCRFPGAPDPDAFWRLLADGTDAITEVPADRWDIDAFYDPDLATPGMMSTRWGGFIPDVDKFDARFFGISPGEAKTMDPQQRLLLEVAWEAIERAGISPARLAGSRTGVFVGIGNNDYGMNCLDRPENINAYFASGNALCMSVNRLSHFFDLTGPSLAIDSGCSSSLAALHYACQSLRLGECTLALVGGVNLILSPQGTVGLSQSWLTAADGRCKSFDEAADGYVRSDGCGMVILKLLADALADRDPILAVVRGSAVNQDGRSVTFTAPSGPAQEAVMRTALDLAGIEPGQVSYVEAHGVGTAMMDLVEGQSIAAVFGDGRDPEDPCIVSSVKTNIGHLEWASGMASLLKVVLALKHEVIPAHLHLKTLIAPLRHASLRTPTLQHPWPKRRAPRRAALNSFGLGGTNVHAVVEEAPADDERLEAARPAHLLVLSAQDPQALAQMTERYGRALEHPPGSLADICFTASVGRAHFAHRAAVIAPSLAALAERVRDLATSGAGEGVLCGGAVSPARPTVIFRFSDHGHGPSSFGAELAAIDPAFRAAVSRCAALLVPRLDLLALLASEAPRDDAAARARTFAIQYGLAEMWRSFGVLPEAFLSEGVGDLVAAVLTGAKGLEEALQAALDLRETPANVSDLRQEPRAAPHASASARPPDRQIVIAMGHGCVAHDVEAIPTTAPEAMAWEQVLRSLAVLYVSGGDVRWEAVDPRQSHARIPLPTYPFQRKSYWLDGRTRGATRAPASAPPPPDAPLRRELDALPEGRRWDALLAHVQRYAASVLGLPEPEALEASRGFFDLGMRSFGAMELRGLLQSALGREIAIPTTVIFERPTTLELARWLAEQLHVPVPDAVQRGGALESALESALERALSAIESLSEEEARAALIRDLQVNAQ